MNVKFQTFIVNAKFQPFRMYEAVSRDIEGHLVGVTTGKDSHNFITLFKKLLFLNEVTIWASSFFKIFIKFIELIAAGLDFGHHNFAPFHGGVSAAHWKCHKIGVKFWWCLQFWKFFCGKEQKLNLK